MALDLVAPSHSNANRLIDISLRTHPLHETHGLHRYAASGPALLRGEVYFKERRALNKVCLACDTHRRNTQDTQVKEPLPFNLNLYSPEPAVLYNRACALVILRVCS